MNRAKYETEFWDKEAERKDVLNAVTDEKVTADRCTRLILPYIESERNIVEIGCGIGRLTIPIAKKLIRSTVIGVDISPNMIKIARRNGSRLKNLRFLINNGRNLDKIPTNTIDAVYSMTTFQHIDAEGVQKYLEEISRILKKDKIFRFQFVEGDEQIEFSQQYSLSQMTEWLEKNDLKVETSKKGLIYPGWVWITAIKL